MPVARSPPVALVHPPTLNSGSNEIVTRSSEVTSPLKRRLCVQRQSDSGPLPWDNSCPSKCPPDCVAISHVCEQLSAKPTAVPEPALTACERTNPRHAPTREGGDVVD